MSASASRSSPPSARSPVTRPRPRRATSSAPSTRAASRASSHPATSPGTSPPTRAGPGTHALAPLVRADRTSARTCSPAEEWLEPHLRRSGLPAPEWNVRLGTYTVDCFWRAQRLAVEIDGFAFHRGRGAFERDHEKDLVLRRMRIDVLRFTARQVKGEPIRVLVDIATELARREGA